MHDAEAVGTTQGGKLGCRESPRFEGSHTPETRRGADEGVRGGTHWPLWASVSCASEELMWKMRSSQSPLGRPPPGFPLTWPGPASPRGPRATRGLLTRLQALQATLGDVVTGCRGCQGTAPLCTASGASTPATDPGSSVMLAGELRCWANNTLSRSHLTGPKLPHQRVQ